MCEGSRVSTVTDEGNIQRRGRSVALHRLEAIDHRTYPSARISAFLSRFVLIGAVGGEDSGPSLLGVAYGVSTSVVNFVYSSWRPSTSTNSLYTQHVNHIGMIILLLRT